MVITLCPHCGKSTEGVVHDKGHFLLVSCEWCKVILGVLPKYSQLVTFKDKGGDEQPRT